MTQTSTNQIRALLTIRINTDRTEIRQILGWQFTVYTRFVIRKFVAIRDDSQIVYSRLKEESYGGREEYRDIPDIRYLRFLGTCCQR